MLPHSRSFLVRLEISLSSCWIIRGWVRDTWHQLSGLYRNVASAYSMQLQQTVCRELPVCVHRMVDMCNTIDV